MHYLALIALIFVGLVLGVLLTGWVFLQVLSTEENISVAIFAALVTIICLTLTVMLLTRTIQAGIFRFPVFR